MPATKRRRLTDLYIVGKEATFDDGHGGVTVWVQVINPVQNEEALRRASAARSRHLTFINQPDTDEYQAAAADLLDFTTHETLIELCMGEELRNRQARIEAELAAAEEWSKDDYLQGLIDAWEGVPDDPDAERRIGLKERYAEDNNDPEARRVKDELDRFNKAAKEAVDHERADLISEWERVPEDELSAAAVKKMLERRAIAAYIDEYETWQIYYAVREPDNHAALYFESVDEVKGLPPVLRGEILGHYQTVAVENQEGKGLPGTPGSSPSSEPSEPEATEPSSGLEAAAQ